MFNNHPLKNEKKRIISLVVSKSAWASKLLLSLHQSFTRTRNTPHHISFTLQNHSNG